MSNMTISGSLGERIAQNELENQGFPTINVNRIQKNVPGYDLLTEAGKSTLLVSVKASGRTSKGRSGTTFNWTKNGFYKKNRPDFVIFVRFLSQNEDDYELYVIPARAVEEFMLESQIHYCSYPSKKGGLRSVAHLTFSWTGEDKEDNISYGFAQKWAEYKNAWSQLQS